MIGVVGHLFQKVKKLMPSDEVDRVSARLTVFLNQTSLDLGHEPVGFGLGLIHGNAR